MKTLFIIFSFLFYKPLIAQKQIVTPYQLGPFKVGEMLENVNSDLGLSLTFTKADYKNFDFVRKVIITEVEYTLVFQDAYDLNGLLLGKKLYSVSVNSAIFKTAEGIGIGSTRQDITNAYPYADICIYTSFDENTGERLMNKNNITVDYIDGKTLGSYYFTLEKNKVTEIMISAIYQENNE